MNDAGVGFFLCWMCVGIGCIRGVVQFHYIAYFTIAKQRELLPDADLFPCGAHRDMHL